MKSSEALKKAKARLLNSQNTYVCTAIEDSGGKKTKVYWRINKLSNGVGISFWLRENSEDYREYLRKSRTNGDFSVAMLKYRLAWIDWMIPQYEAVGD